MDHETSTILSYLRLPSAKEKESSFSTKYQRYQDGKPSINKTHQNPTSAKDIYSIPSSLEVESSI